VGFPLGDVSEELVVRGSEGIVFAIVWGLVGYALLSISVRAPHRRSVRVSRTPHSEEANGSGRGSRWRYLGHSRFDSSTSQPLKISGPSRIDLPFISNASCVPFLI
jgi:hypothetical protein